MDPAPDTHPGAAETRAAPSGVVWRAPGLRVLGSRSWGRVSAATFARGAGESLWRGEQHRLLLVDGEPGPTTVRIDGGRTREFVGSPGALAFYPAGATVRVALAHGHVEQAQVLLDPAFFRTAAEEAGSGRAGLEPRIPFQDPLIAGLVRALAREAGGGGPCERLLVDGLSLALAAQLARRLAGPAPPPPVERCETTLSRERLRRVLDHVEAHLGADLTLAELADVACLSPFHFSRCFKQATGVGPRRYVLRRRVERAKELLRRTDQPLVLVAQALGFADQSHFASTFRRETGVTPSRFRAGAGVEAAAAA
jgi:AraC family transcriptional regulator